MGVAGVAKIVVKYVAFADSVAIPSARSEVAGRRFGAQASFLENLSPKKQTPAEAISIDGWWFFWFGASRGFLENQKARKPDDFACC